MSQLTVPGTQVLVAKVIDGIEMGVMSDGTAYLSARTLAGLCGVAPSSIIEARKRWAEGARSGPLMKFIAASGIARSDLYITGFGDQGQEVQGVPDDVCIVFLDYYAHETEGRNPAALTNFRKLALRGLQKYVYDALGFDPSTTVPIEWREFTDRVRLHTLPSGFFSCFQEMFGLMTAALRAGISLDYKTVPDISVGKSWSAHWEKKGLAAEHGDRKKHEHNFPSYFPQSVSNPQDMWVYPNAALAEFRRWMDEDYLPTKFPKYIKGKVTAGLLSAEAVRLLLDEVAPDPQRLLTE